MQPDIEELRGIRNSYFKNNTYQKNKRNNTYNYEKNERNNEYSYDNSRNNDSFNNTNRRATNGVIEKIEFIIKIIFKKNINVVYGIIVLNVIVHILWEIASYNKEEFYDEELLRFMNNHFTISWNNLIKRKRYWTLITSTFSHKSIIHLTSNMSTFYYFALPVINRIGKKRFLMAYFLAGIGSSYSHVFFYHIVVPKLIKNYNRNYLFDLFYSSYMKYSYDNVSSLGASGAITGINTIFSCLFPTRLVSYNNRLRLPSWLYMVLFMVGDFYRSVTLTNGNIDTIGHVGGGIVGYIYYFYNLI
ncbi:rhomboid-domain-containing protein [Piromyces finnis]|uniref:Rhomboid-domain-containing protein n=1 Tax=Piromyces finnis TaxID=1754191 RepID=A0A1Y1VMU7_9FUNG|nr:rhomboid-domain-containing protein [Piromyces finnis]|eukprot:ORX60099.1 rhomboid-domain-containing protein [Piromyces finnis]